MRDILILLLVILVLLGLLVQFCNGKVHILLLLLQAGVGLQAGQSTFTNGNACIWRAGGHHAKTGNAGGKMFENVQPQHPAEGGGDNAAGGNQ